MEIHINSLIYHHRLLRKLHLEGKKAGVKSAALFYQKTQRGRETKAKRERHKFKYAKDA